MKKGVKTGLIVGGIVVVLVLIWYLASPLFLNDRVSEENPFGSMEEGVLDNGSVQESELQVVLAGSFMDADEVHKVMGSAEVITDGNDVYLRFENFEATNGPGLKVYLANDLNANDYVSLGDLKGNVGDQNYNLEGIDYESYDYVLIWCEPFGVLFGYSDIE